MSQVTLIAVARTGLADLAGGFAVRVPQTSDIEQLGQLYFGCGVPGASLTSAAEAIQEVSSFFCGEFGAFWPDASGVVEFGGRLVAALLTVHRAPWDDTPACPFITDLFTDPRVRRHGLARMLLTRCMTQVAGAGQSWVALRAESDNTPAMRLYRAMGFTPYQPAGK